MDRHIKIPTYWLELFEGITHEEVGKIIRAVFIFAKYGTVTIPDGLGDKAVAAFHTCIEDIKYQFSHPRAWRKPVNNAEIRRCKEYCDWRKTVYERDHYTCQICGCVGGKLNAHHIKPFAKYPDLRLELSNGITLCKRCHDSVHQRRRKDA